MISLFASEKEFPEIANPLAMTFDTRGWLWVLTSATYPHVLPGVPPHDKRFTVPARTGSYPYVCTFPGHWRTKNGLMQVVRAGTTLPGR
jgi:hypothetical protein